MRTLLPKKAYLDKLCGEIVRSRGECENPECPRDGTMLTWAHIIGRSCLRLRWRVDNAFCLCLTCHQYYHAHPSEWEGFCRQIMGDEAYDNLQSLASYNIDNFLKVDYVAINKYLLDLKRKGCNR